MGLLMMAKTAIVEVLNNVKTLVAIPLPAESNKRRSVHRVNVVILRIARYNGITNYQIVSIVLHPQNQLRAFHIINKDIFDLL